jgi:hypothetical protein
MKHQQEQGSAGVNEEPKSHTPRNTAEQKMLRWYTARDEIMNSRKKGLSTHEAFSWWSDKLRLEERKKDITPVPRSRLSAGTPANGGLMKPAFSHWIPTAFCAFISLMALVVPLLRPHGTDQGWGTPAFFAFLPMCFYFLGVTTAQMRRELSELRERLSQLEQKKSA